MNFVRQEITPYAINEKSEGLFWGPITSTIDWCEENYVTVVFFAEFWNSITNLVFFALAGFGIYRVRYLGLENRFILCYLGMIMVGAGSWLFHMTLKYEWQLADELPMIYCTAFALNGLFQTGIKSSYEKPIQGALILYCAVVTLVYLYNRDPVFHEVAYGVEVGVYTLYGVYSQTGASKQKPYLHKKMVHLMWHSFLLFLASFAAWNIDNLYCDSLQDLRGMVHPIVAPLFQFHALWHIGTGIGCYEAIVHQQMLRIIMLDLDHIYTVDYFMNLVPYIKKIKQEQQVQKSK